MITPGSLRETQICTASCNPGGSSSAPPLMLIVVLPSPACHSRVPQVGQNALSKTRPESPAQDQWDGVPCVNRSASCGTITEMPNAEADCLRHLRQWQT